jgi:cation:H+ antiporter
LKRIIIYTIFLIALIRYILLIFRRKGGTYNIKKTSFHQEIYWSTKKSIFEFVALALMMAYGAYAVVEPGTAIADRLGVSKTFIGFSLLALGNSVPEIFVASIAALRKQNAILHGI